MSGYTPSGLPFEAKRNRCELHWLYEDPVNCSTCDDIETQLRIEKERGEISRLIIDMANLDYAGIDPQASRERARELYREREDRTARAKDEFFDRDIQRIMGSVLDNGVAPALDADPLGYADGARDTNRNGRSSGSSGLMSQRTKPSKSRDECVTSSSSRRSGGSGSVRRRPGHTSAPRGPYARPIKVERTKAAAPNEQTEGAMLTDKRVRDLKEEYKQR